MADCRFSSSLSICVLTVLNDCSRAPSSVRALPKFCMLVVKRPMARWMLALSLLWKAAPSLIRALKMLPVSWGLTSLPASVINWPPVICTGCGCTTTPLPSFVGSLVVSSEAVKAALAAGSFCKAAMTLLAVVCGEI